MHGTTVFKFELPSTSTVFELSTSIVMLTRHRTNDGMRNLIRPAGLSGRASRVSAPVPHPVVSSLSRPQVPSFLALDCSRKESES